MSLLIVGTVAFDGIETPFGRVDKILGGSATYIGVAASYFIEKSNLISVVGGDFKQKDIHLLESHGINCEGLEIISNGETFFWSGRYHENMNFRDTLETRLNVLEKFDPKIPLSFQDCDYLMLANLMPSIQLKAIHRLSKQPKLIVTDTMNYWIDNCLEDLLEVISKTDLLIVNDEEALELTKSKEISQAAEQIFQMGPKIVIIKRGTEGAVLFSGETFFECPVYSVKKCIDPTGAGDTFAGALVGYLTYTNDLTFDNLKRAVIRACAVASFCVEDFGVNHIINKSKEEIDYRINKLKNLIE